MSQVEFNVYNEEQEKAIEIVKMLALSTSEDDSNILKNRLKLAHIRVKIAKSLFESSRFNGETEPEFNPLDSKCLLYLNALRAYLRPSECYLKGLLQEIRMDLLTDDIKNSIAKYRIPLCQSPALAVNKPKVPNPEDTQELQLRKKIMFILENNLSVTDEWGGTKLSEWKWGNSVVIDGFDQAADEILNAIKLNDGVPNK